MRYVLRLSREQPLAELEAASLAEALALPDVVRILAQCGAGLEIVAFGEDEPIAQSWTMGPSSGWQLSRPSELELSTPEIHAIDEIEESP